MHSLSLTIEICRPTLLALTKLQLYSSRVWYYAHRCASIAGLTELEQPSMRRAHERVIETWILTIITDGGIQRFDDLHVDVINKRWNSPRLWIQGGIEYF